MQSSIQPAKELFGAGVFKDPNGREWVLIALDGAIYRHREHNGRMRMDMPEGVEIHGRVTFTQAFDRVFCWRGRYIAPLVMTDLDTGWTDVIPRWDATVTYGLNADTTNVPDEVAWGPFQHIGVLTSSGLTATAYFDTPHGYVTGADIAIHGADQAEYNGRFNVTVIDELTVSFQFAGSATSPATGWFLCSDNSTYWKSKIDGNLNYAPVGTVNGVPDNNWDQIYNVIPNADEALYINNLMLIPTAWTPGNSDYSKAGPVLGANYTKKDFLLATDILDPIHTQFTNELRINQGDDDEIVGLLKYNDDQVIICKGRSWGILSGLRMGLDQVSLDMRGDIYGACSPASMVVAGRDAMWPSLKRGIVSLFLTEHDALQSQDVPFSNAIQAYVDKINWTVADQMRLAWWDDRLYWAVAINGAAQNNAMFIYDFRTSAWAGIDQGPSICPKEFFYAMYCGVERLFFLGNDGYTYMVEEFSHGDQVGNALSPAGVEWSPIVTSFDSRGYKTDDDTWLRWKRAKLVLATLNANYSVSVSTSGARSAKTVISNRMQDRTQFLKPFDAQARDESNSGDDFNAENRADYALVLPEAGFYCGSGIGLSTYQEFTRTVSVRSTIGRFVQVHITNAAGRLKIKSIGPHAKDGAQIDGEKN